MAKPYETIIAIDLGTSTATTKIVFAYQEEINGKIHRKKVNFPLHSEEVSDWPFSSPVPPGFRSRLPTYLIYSLERRNLVYWGFEAKEIIENTPERIRKENLFVIEAPKTLLVDGEITPTTQVERRRNNRRKEMWERLRKLPFEVYEDFLCVLLEHVLSSHLGQFKRDVYRGLQFSSSINLVLAFPAGWNLTIHAKLAQSATIAMRKAIDKNGLRHLHFQTANVWTTSETICGVKEWMKERMEGVQSLSDLYADHKKNYDWMEEGEDFLVLDIGAGTGCSTPLRLDTKNPPKITQLGETKSLAICGDAVEAEFEGYLKSRRITHEDCPKNLEATLSKICTWFKEKKKTCGDNFYEGKEPWQYQFPHLRANARKGFEDEMLPIPRKVFEDCFDKVIEQLLAELDRTLKAFPRIKVGSEKIVVLGEFGSASRYLRKKIEQSSLVRKDGVQLEYSPYGKMNVVRGALGDLLHPHEQFTRHLVTYRSIDKVVTREWSKGGFTRNMWPNPKALGAIEFEKEDGELWLNLIESGIPKGFPLKDQMVDEGDNPRWRSWTMKEPIELEDWLIVSDEEPGIFDPESGKSYRLFTHDHLNNTLVVNGKRIDVQIIKFFWDISKAFRPGIDGQRIPCTPNDLMTERTGKRKMTKKGGKQAIMRRKLEYTLAFEISETQIKVFLRAHMQIGKLDLVRVNERSWKESDTIGGESRLLSLQNEIDISSSAKPTESADPTAVQELLSDDSESNCLSASDLESEFEVRAKPATKRKHTRQKPKKLKLANVEKPVKRKYQKRTPKSGTTPAQPTRQSKRQKSRNAAQTDTETDYCPVHVQLVSEQPFSASQKIDQNVPVDSCIRSNTSKNEQICSSCDIRYIRSDSSLQEISTGPLVCQECASFDPFYRTEEQPQPKPIRRKENSHNKVVQPTMANLPQGPGIGRHQEAESYVSREIANADGPWESDGSMFEVESHSSSPKPYREKQTHILPDSGQQDPFLVSFPLQQPDFQVEDSITVSSNSFALQTLPEATGKVRTIWTAKRGGGSGAKRKEIRGRGN